MTDRKAPVTLGHGFTAVLTAEHGATCRTVVDRLGSPRKYLYGLSTVLEGFTTVCREDLCRTKSQQISTLYIHDVGLEP